MARSDTLVVQPLWALSIDTSRYSERTKLLVQQALDEQERIGWAKAFRGSLSLTWGLLEAPHKEVDNPYNKTPHTTQRVGDFDARQPWNVQ